MTNRSTPVICFAAGLSFRLRILKNNRLKSVYVLLQKRFPYFADLLLRAHRGGLIRLPRKNVRGTENQLVIRGSAVLKGVSFEIRGNRNRIEIGSGCYLNNVKFFIQGNSHVIVLGENVRFNRGGDFWMEDERGLISIGKDTSMENVHLAVTGRGKAIRVGSDCLFAYDIDVRTGDSHAVVDLAGAKLNDENDVIVGDHVWAAAHCSILKGSRLSRGSIIATRSTVTKAFDEENILLGGSPARVLKSKVTWTSARFPSETLGL